jgi:hypothetical protein
MADEEKKSFSERFAEYFMSLDLKAIIRDEIKNTLWPHLLDTLVDSAKMTFSNTIDQIAYQGDKDRIRQARAQSKNGQMPYNSMYAGKGNQPRRLRAAGLIGQPAYVVEDIVFTDDQDLQYGKTGKEKAEEVQAYLQSLLDSGRYDFVTVATLYGASKIPTRTWMENYGWYSLSGLRLFQNNEGWVIRMPQPQPID